MISKFCLKQKNPWGKWPLMGGGGKLGVLGASTLWGYIGAPEMGGSLGTMSVRIFEQIHA